MAISPVQLPAALPTGHPNLLNTDYDRDGDPVFRLNDRPVEMYRYTGDGATTSKTGIQSGFDRVSAGMVFDMTSGTYYPVDILVTANASDPTQFDLNGIYADTHVYLVIIWGDKTVAVDRDAINQLAPSAPVQTAGVVNSAVQVTLNWLAAQHASLPITGYEYQKDAGAWTDVGNVLTIAVTGLTTATTYAFKIRSYVTDVEGNKVVSAASNTVSLTTS